MGGGPGNNDTTGITNTTDTLTDDDGSWYTVNGHKLSEKPTRKGMYIHNGRKVVVK